MSAGESSRLETPITARSSILAFAIVMEREFRANAHKDDHPLSHDFEHLIDQLRDHVEKFAADPTSEHAADVANLALLAYTEHPRA